MSILENYEKRFKLRPLDPDDISFHVGAAEETLRRAQDANLATSIRTVVWLHDRLQAAYDALENPAAPVAARCAWCFRAGLQTDETWHALPKMTLDDAAAHSQVCEHNPLVQEVRRLTALLDGFVHGEGKP